jgi:AcrR family transcriptional regulator
MAGDPTTEERIFDAARRVFLQQGPQARMQDVASEAGITQSLLHYYYRNRDRLFEAVFRKEASRLIPREIGILNSDLSIQEKVETIVADYLDFLLKNPHLPSFVAYELNYHPERLQEFMRSVGKPDLQKLSQQIDSCVEDGTMMPIPPEQFLVNLLSLCVFPFIARPMLNAVLGLDDQAFARFIEDRKVHLPSFFLNALRPGADAT